MSDNKLVKSILDAATITGLVAGIGWIGRKIIKEDLTKDPSANVTNYVKFTAVMAGSIALKKYLEDRKKNLTICKQNTMYNTRYITIYNSTH